MAKKKSTIDPETAVGSLDPATVIVQPADAVDDLTVGIPS